MCLPRVHLPLCPHSLQIGAQWLQQRGHLQLQPGQMNFLWVVSFPLLEEEDGKLCASHHPFTAPLAADVQKLEHTLVLFACVQHCRTHAAQSMTSFALEPFT
jgi:hypothetical protein